jgi:hypothetical protein
MDNDQDSVTGSARFHYTVKCRPLPAGSLEVNAKYQPRLVTFEIDEVEAGS